MERKIGEIFEYNGEWYQVVECDSCGECSLRATECGSGTKSDLADEVFGECSKVRRSDSRHTIFKKLEKVGEPYPKFILGRGNIKVQRYKLYCSTNTNICNGIWIYHWNENLVDIEIKQNKEDMEEKYKAENTPLTRLVGRYVNNLIDYNVFEKAVKELYADKEESKPNLKPFNLEAAKAGNPVCTRDGKKVRIICFDLNTCSPYSVIAAVTNDSGYEEVTAYMEDGCYLGQNEESSRDLMMLSEKKEGWINVYALNTCYSSKEEAEANIDRDYENEYVRTVKINWEE